MGYFFKAYFFIIINTSGLVKIIIMSVHKKRMVRYKETLGRIEKYESK